MSKLNFLKKYEISDENYNTIYNYIVNIIIIII